MPNMFYDYKRYSKIHPPPIHKVMDNLMENSHNKLLET